MECGCALDVYTVYYITTFTCSCFILNFVAWMHQIFFLLSNKKIWNQKSSIVFVISMINNKHAGFLIVLLFRLFCLYFLVMKVWLWSLYYCAIIVVYVHISKPCSACLPFFHTFHDCFYRWIINLFLCSEGFFFNFLLFFILNVLHFSVVLLLFFYF